MVSISYLFADTDIEDFVEHGPAKNTEPDQDSVQQQKAPDTEKSGAETTNTTVKKRTKSDPVNMTKEQEDDLSEWLQKNPHHYDMSVSKFQIVCIHYSA